MRHPAQVMPMQPTQMAPAPAQQGMVFAAQPPQAQTNAATVQLRMQVAGVEDSVKQMSEEMAITRSQCITALQMVSEAADKMSKITTIEKAFGVAYKKIEENEKKLLTVLGGFGDIEADARACVESLVNKKFEDVKKQRGWDLTILNTEHRDLKRQVKELSDIVSKLVKAPKAPAKRARAAAAAAAAAAATSAEAAPNVAWADQVEEEQEDEPAEGLIERLAGAAPGEARSSPASERPRRTARRVAEEAE